MASIFPLLAEKLATNHARSFKIGRGAQGILRPDKMVAYFDDPESLYSAADDLAPTLEGIPVHGVPFTAGIGANGLLSWGMDPPKHLPSAKTFRSWRRWIAQGLGVALSGSGATSASPEHRLSLALNRLRLERIDTETWAPPLDLWRAPSVQGV